MLRVMVILCPVTQPGHARTRLRVPRGVLRGGWFVLARMTSVQIVERCNNREASNRTSPLGLAEEFGYKSLNQIRCEKIKAEQERWKNTPITVLDPAVFYANLGK